MRINGFEQIKALYSMVFESQYDFKPQHISLYVFLINQNNRNNWVEWFKCPYDLAMAGSCIGSKKTYYKCLNDLMDWGLLKYEKGSNDWKAPKIKLEVLKCTSTYTSSVPQSEPLHTQVDIPLHTPQDTHNIKPITINNKPKTEIPDYQLFLDYFKSLKQVYKPELEFSLQSKYETWVENGWKDGNGKKIVNWKTKLKNTIPFLRPIYKQQEQKEVNYGNNKS